MGIMYGKKAPTTVEQQHICDLYRSGLRLQDVAERTGFCIATVKKFMELNGCVARQRGKLKGSGRVRDFDDEELIKFKASWDKLPSTMKGTIAETYAKNRLAELGFDMWEPFGQNHVTDLIILRGNKLHRIQVKSATYDKKTKAFRANVTRHRRGGKMTSYTLDDVDFFVIYCGGLETLQFYIVPANKVIGRTDLKLYPHRPKGLMGERSVDWIDYNNAFHLLGDQR